MFARRFVEGFAVIALYLGHILKASFDDATLFLQATQSIRPDAVDAVAPLTIILWRGMLRSMFDLPHPNTNRLR